MRGTGPTQREAGNTLVGNFPLAETSHGLWRSGHDHEGLAKKLQENVDLMSIDSVCAATFHRHTVRTPIDALTDSTEIFDKAFGGWKTNESRVSYGKHEVI